MCFAINKIKLLSIGIAFVRCRASSVRLAHVRCGDDPSMPSLRFIQFLRANSNCPRLGVVSEDGSHLIDLGAQGLFPHKLTQFLQSKYSICELEALLPKMQSKPVPDVMQILSPIMAPDKILAIRADPSAAAMAHDKCHHSPSIFQPIITNRLPSALAGPTDYIRLPPGVSQIECRTELAIVMGENAKNVSAHDAMDYVFGYSVGLLVNINKWTDESLDFGPQKLISNASDTFCPFGPTVVHKSLIERPEKLMVTLKVNEELEECADDLAFPIAETIAYITQFIALRPGDIILTGPPSFQNRCCRPTAKAGDVIECEIANIGKLRNEVIATE